LLDSVRRCGLSRFICWLFDIELERLVFYIRFALPGLGIFSVVM
jgi:hypothetical protein